MGSQDTKSVHMPSWLPPLCLGCLLWSWLRGWTVGLPIFGDAPVCGTIRPGYSSADRLVTSAVESASTLSGVVGFSRMSSDSSGSDRADQNQGFLSDRVGSVRIGSDRIGSDWIGSDRVG